MMRIHSIKFKITLLMVSVIALLIGLLMGINSLLAEKVYVNKKQNAMLNSYNSLEDIMDMFSRGEINEDEMLVKMENISTAKGISVLVVDSGWTTIYASNQDDPMLERLRISIFNGDRFQFDKKINEENELSDEQKNTHRTEKRQIIKSTDEYMLQKIFDNRLNDYYLEMWGTLNSGYSVILRTPIQSIKDNVAISTQLIKYVGLIVLAIGIAAAFVVSGFITAPIKQISHIAEKMSELDFDVKYTGSDKGEIGVLGSSINNMSKKLEENIGELKQANIELKRDIDKKEKLEKMRTEFISNVSHELKTPIALIQGYAEGLKEGITDDPESMDYYIDVIIDETNKMNSMVRKLLTLNQIEQGEEGPVLERFDINELIKSLVDANGLLADKKNVSITFEQTEEPIMVWADEYRIEEVITNYLTNAINHSDGKKAISVNAVKIDGKARISVYNSGNNIPDEDIERIWEKFYKVDKARTREYGGNGIGLSIVKAIMESLGQNYGVRNVSDGVEFWFELEI